MKRETLILSLVSIAFLVSSFVIDQRNSVNFLKNDAFLSESELKCATGEGCASDCALAVTYCILSVKYWWYLPLCAIYTNMCANCGGGGGGGCVPDVHDEDVCDGDVTSGEHGAGQCDLAGGQIMRYNNGCQQVTICCIEDW